MFLASFPYFSLPFSQEVRSSTLFPPGSGTPESAMRITPLSTMTVLLDPYWAAFPLFFPSLGLESGECEPDPTFFTRLINLGVVSSGAPIGPGGTPTGEAQWTRVKKRVFSFV